MTEKIIIAGAGGQGVMLLGKVLADTAMRAGKKVTLLPAYGAEVRGGSAFCMAVISDAEIGSPYIDEADTLIAMNEVSLRKFTPRLKKKGLLVLNTSFSARPAGKGFSLAAHPFTDLAIGLGNIRIANMLALGCYLAQKMKPQLKTAGQAIAGMAPPDKKGLVEINCRALLKGAELK